MRIMLTTLLVISSLVSQVRAADPPYTCIAFTPDGTELVAGSQKGVQVFSWPALEPRGDVVVAMPNVNDIAFSNDGSRLAVGGGIPGEDGLVEFYSWPERERLFRESCCFDLVYAVAFNSDDSMVAAASLDNSAALLDTTTGNVERYLEGHSRGLTGIDFLNDSNQVITGAIDQSLRVWNLEEKKPLRNFNNHTQPIHDLEVSPGTEGLPMLASASADRTLRVWQPTIGRMVRFVRLKSAPLAISWFADGERVAVSCDDGKVRVIDVSTIEVLQEFDALDGWAYAVAVHPDGKEIAVGGSFGQLKRLKVRAQ